MREEINPHTGKKWIELSKEEIKMGFLAQCVEALAEEENCDYIDMLYRLERADMTEGFILKFYEPLHSQSWENIINDLKEMLLNHESTK